MKSLLIVVPMHNYSEGVVRILDWAQSSSVLNSLDWRLLICDDGSREDEVARAKEVDLLPQFLWEETPAGEKLRYAYKRAGFLAEELGFDAVLSCESDAVPNDTTLAAMIDLFENPVQNWSQPAPKHYRRVWRDGDITEAPTVTPESFGEVISTSPVYTWKGRHCYPSQPVWLYASDNRDCFEVKRHVKLGQVGMAEAVPFLFALWKPWALRRINEQMPTLYRLDTCLGLTLWREGNINLRLIDHSIEHVGGGRQSR